MGCWFGLWGHVLRIVKRFRGGLVFNALRLLYHSTLGLREIKKKITGFGAMASRCDRVICVEVYNLSCGFKV